jgi:hypothetical protein
LFSGLDISKTTSIFTKEGLNEIDRILTTRGSNPLTPLETLKQNPEKLWEVINGIKLEIQTLIDDAGSISDGAKYFSVDPKDILSFKGSKVAAGGLPDVFPVGLFYKAEAERIQKEVLFNLLEEEAFRGGSKITSLFDKEYVDYYFDNFFDMDKMFGHENSLVFGTRGLPVGHPQRTSKSFDRYNAIFGPAIVRVLKNSELNENIYRIKELMVK